MGMAGFTINDALIKSIDHSVSLGQVLAIRGLFLSCLLLLLVYRYRALRSVSQLRSTPVVLRALADVGGTFLFLEALRHLPFANIVSILQALPLVVTLGAALILGEQVGWRRYLAIFVGFAGVLIIVRPGFEGFNGYSLLVLAVVLLASARDLLTRKVPPEVPSLLITLVTAVVVQLAGWISLATVSDWISMDSMTITKLAAASVFLFFGYHGVVLAMREGEISAIAPLRYSSLIWAVLIGYLFFGEMPDLVTFTGTALIVASGLYAIHRDRLSIRKV